MLNMAISQKDRSGSHRRNFPAGRSFEIFVQHGFSELEVAAITHTLQVANRIVEENLCKWSFVSDTPGFVTGAGGQIVRAIPAVPDHGLSDQMIVIGATSPKPQEWLPRIRSMTRQGRIVTFLSSAATAYIQAVKPKTVPVTTHWSDLAMLQETGCLSQISTRLSERNGNVITAAGAGATSEIVVGLLADILSAREITEIGNHLILPSIRNGRADQPNSIGDIYPCFDNRLSQAIKVMEKTLEEPIQIGDLTRKIGVSTRQLERVFKAVLGTTPARFYKRLRLKRARTLIEETPLNFMEIALASGFASSNSLAKAFRDEYGMSPSRMRTRKIAPRTAEVVLD